MTNSPIIESQWERKSFKKLIQSFIEEEGEKRSFISSIRWAINLSRPYKKYVIIILTAMLFEALRRP